MKKILFLLLISQICFGQTSQWAKRAGTATGDDFGYGICADKANNVYITGQMDSTYKFCDTAHILTHYNYCFISKYTPAGQVRWTQKVIGINNNLGLHVCTDSSANVFVAGQFIDTSFCHKGIVFNTRVAVRDTFTHDTTIIIHDTTTLVIHGTTIVDTVYYFDRDTMRGNSLAEVFITKYDSAGNFKWASKVIGLNTNISVNEMSAGPNGDIYITGQFNGTAKFDKDTVYSSGNGDYYLAKYSSDSGKVKWVKHGASVGNSVAVDQKSGIIYAAGTYQNTATFGTLTLNSMGNVNNDDIFLAAVDTGGNYLWVKGIGGSWEDHVHNIALDTNGNIFVTGLLTPASDAFFGIDTLHAYPGDIFLAKYNSAGIEQWAKMAGGSTLDEVNAIAVDNAGNAYLTGDFQNVATFGSHTLGNNGGQDIFISKYNSSGTILGSTSVGGPSDDVARGIALDGNGDLYITGSFKDTCKFGGVTANRLISAAGSDAFVAKTGINVSVSDIKSTGSVTFDAYPNPTTGDINIYFSTKENTSLTIKLTNMNGQVVYNEQKSQFIGVYRTTVDFCHHAKGVYFLEMITDKETMVKKIILN